MPTNSHIMKSKKKTKHVDYTDLAFMFKNIPFTVDFGEEVEPDTKKQVNEIIDIISNDISIDKSYVNVEGNLHQDTFIDEDGWNELCKLLKDTNFGNTATEEQNDEMSDAYMLMVIAYAYSILELYDIDIEDITIGIKPKTKFTIEFYKDYVQSWRLYKGPWQDWKN